MTIRISLAILCFAALACSGCGGKPAATPPKPDETTQPKGASDKEPAIAGLDTIGQAASDQMIDAAKVAEHPKEEAYVQDDNCPAGTLDGYCCIALDKPLADDAEVRQPQRYDFTGIKNPIDADVKVVDRYSGAKVSGEEGYYARLNTAKEAVMLVPRRRTNRIGVLGTVIKFLDVKRGPRSVLGRTGYAMNRGILDEWNMNGRHFGTCISMLNERLLFCTYDRFPCDIVIADPAGKAVWEHNIPQWTVDIEGKGWTVPAPKAVTSSSISELGLYSVSCKRHPWHKGTLHVVDNPYAYVIDRESSRQMFGAFSLPLVPAGKHTIEIWHPVYEPEQKTIEIEIQPDRTLTIEIKFKPPADLFVKPQPKPKVK